MGRECSMHEMRNAYKLWLILEKFEARDHLRGLGIDGRIMLKWMLKKQGVKVWTAFNRFKIGSTGGLLRTQ
jgi:hypothetical protein